MRAVWYEGGGPAAEVLQIGELGAPQPGEGEVRVRVAYSSVNPFDIKKRVHGAELAYWDRVVPRSLIAFLRRLFFVLAMLEVALLFEDEGKNHPGGLFHLVHVKIVVSRQQFMAAVRDGGGARLVP